MRTARLTAASFFGKYLSRIFSASSFEMEFEGTLTSTPSRRTSSIRRLVSIFRSLARSYRRTLEVTADMRSLLLAKSVASTTFRTQAPRALLHQGSQARRTLHSAYAKNVWTCQKHFIASRPLCLRPSRPHRRKTELRFVQLKPKQLPLLRLP